MAYRATGTRYMYSFDLLSLCSSLICTPPPLLQEQHLCQSNSRCGFCNFWMHSVQDLNRLVCLCNFWNHGIWWFHFLIVHEDEVGIWGWWQQARQYYSPRCITPFLHR